MTQERAVSKQRRGPADGGFRLLLVLGAVVSIAIGIWGVLWTGMLEIVLGFDLPRRSLAITRVYGGVMLAIGIAYALAAAQPQRSRSLLVPLFVVPVITAITMLAGVARGEIHGAKGSVFVVWNLAFCLLYFRLYPRVPEVDGPVARAGEEPPLSPSR